MVDSENHRIQVFTADRKFLRMFGKKGAGRGKVDWLHGVAVDASGLVYVSEESNHCVSVFTSEGKFMGPVGKNQDSLIIHVDWQWMTVE